MNQSVSVDFGNAMALVAAAGIMVSTCSIYAPTQAIEGDSGQVNLTDMTPVAGLQNIKCMIAPLADYKPNPHVLQRQTQFISEQQWNHVLLDGYYTGIKRRYVALIDSTYFIVLNVENDSQHTQTRMAVEFYSV